MSDFLSKTPLQQESAKRRVTLIGIVLSAVWIIGVGLFFWMMPSGSDEPVDSLRIVLMILAVFMPVGLIWVAVVAAQSNMVVREESQRLQAAIDGMRASLVAAPVTGAASVAQPTVERKLEEIAMAAKKTEDTLATFASNRDALRKKMDVAAVEPESQDQTSFALGTRAEDMAPPLPNVDFIRAANFPDTDQDQEGFAALRRALQDRHARELIQASQDVLTLLSQDGIYMDDLRPDRARPEIWRRFAGGERGRAMAALGGVRDRSSLALTAARMREDTIFRDTAHHFLRKFDQMLVRFEADASDEELIALAETRSARAFMILGRVTGAFD